MRIAVISLDYERASGSGALAWTLADGLRSAGHEVLLAGSNLVPYREADTERPPNLHGALSLFERLRRAYRVATHAQLAEVDLVVVNTIVQPEVVLACRARGLRTIVWIHESGAAVKSATVGPQKLISMIAASAVVTPALHATKRTYRAILVPNPCIEGGIKVERPNRGLRNLVFVGSADRIKGFHHIPKLVEALPASDPQWTISIFGRSGNISSSQIDQIQSDCRSNPSVLVKFNGRADPLEMFRESDVFVSLSESETAPLSAIEALCNGLRVVALDLPAYREMRERLAFESQDLVACFPDIESMARELDHYANHSQFYSSIDSSIQAEFSVSVFLERWQIVLESIAPRHTSK